jgi:hypothetical protein
MHLINYKYINIKIIYLSVSFIKLFEFYDSIIFLNTTSYKFILAFSEFKNRKSIFMNWVYVIVKETSKERSKK